jgi:cation diffusion facilitator family transporter
MNPASRNRLTPEGVTWLGLWSNVLLFVAKTGAGLAGRSQVLLADGIHSLSDLVSDAVALVALRLGRMPEDPAHPYGHGKIEDLAALFVGLLLAVVALGIAIRAVFSLREGVEPERSPWLFLVAVVSVLIKEGLFHLTQRVGRRESSATLLANAWHHRSDAVSSLATVLGTGLFLLDERLVWADGASALVVAAFILRAAWNIARDAARDLVDTAPGAEQMDRLADAVRRVPGVVGLAGIRGRYYSQRIILDLEIEVEGSITVEAGHDVALKVRSCILEKFPEVLEVMVHVDPCASDSSGKPR